MVLKDTWQGGRGRCEKKGGRCGKGAICPGPLR